MEKDFRFLIYKSEEEDVAVDAVVKDESIWLSQKGMAELFGVDKSTISRHLKNVFEEGELSETVDVAKIATTTAHGAIPEKTQTTESRFYKGNVSRKAALAKAEAEYDIFNKTQRITSDFDREVKKTD